VPPSAQWIRVAIEMVFFSIKKIMQREGLRKIVFQSPRGKVGSFIDDPSICVSYIREEKLKSSSPT
jgi:hypothetical protein